MHDPIYSFQVGANLESWLADHGIREPAYEASILLCAGDVVTLTAVVAVLDEQGEKLLGPDGLPLKRTVSTPLRSLPELWPNQ